MRNRNPATFINPSHKQLPHNPHMPVPNRLIHESSPYLLQHAYNPVDWYPWGEEAHNKSREENKLIFLSIGYSSCHWCHVMAHESFEDPEVAGYLNRHFVSIKVDREERPDLDSVYMDAVQLMTGQGGWPLNVWLTPQLVPVYGGTYFPPKSRTLGGLSPDFMTILERLVHVYHNEPEQIANHVKQMQSALQTDIYKQLDVSPIDRMELDKSFTTIHNLYDAINGGFSRAPKFPHPMTIEFLFQYAILSGNKYATAMALHSLQSMIYGGIYDQIGGGFHRYSTDKYWLVPHFEKMLYDNALLLSTLTSAWQISKVPVYRETVEETVEFLTREMRQQGGGFYSALDADSDGKEGLFYVWTSDELKKILSDDELETLRQWYPFEPAGNWDGFIILNRGPVSQPAFTDEETQPAKDGSWNRLKIKLLNVRNKRKRPGTDYKILTAWNGLLIKSLIHAGRTFNRSDWIKTACDTADFILRNMYRDGLLYRIHCNGRAHQSGFLDDYGSFIEALTFVFEVTANEYYLTQAITLTEKMLLLFHDPHQDAFYYSHDGQDTPLASVRDIFDNVTPSGTSSAVAALLRLSDFTGDIKYHDIAVSALGKLHKMASEHATSFGYLLQCLAHEHMSRREIIVTGPDNKREEWREEWAGIYAPHDIFIEGTGFPDTGLSLLKNKKAVRNQTTAYICEHFSCKAPVTDLNEYIREIGKKKG